MPALLDLPDVRMRDDFDCGWAVFRTVCGYFAVTGRKVVADPIHGVHPEYLEPAFRQAGLWTQSGSMTLDDLRHHHRLGRPVVCLVRIDGGGHWVVVRGVTRSRVHFHDPADGRQSLPFAEWESRWIDTDRAGTVFRQHGISVLN